MAHGTPYTGDEPAEDNQSLTGDLPDTGSPDEQPGHGEHAGAHGTGNQPPNQDGDRGLNPAA